MRRRGFLISIGVLAFYVALVVVLLGRGVVVAPQSHMLGDRGADKSIFMWSLVWWPHALWQGLDPFVSHVIWAPHGIDLAWVTAIPGPSMLVFPLTWAVGPVATYNVLALAAPALAAWATFVLARRLTGRFWPSLIAGYLFGFSAYEMGQSVGHLNLTLVFLVPLCALLVVQRVTGRLSRAAFVALLGLGLALQFWFSTEIFVTLLFASVVFALIALWRTTGRERLRVRTTSLEALMAVALSGVLSLPYLIQALVVTGPSYAPVRSPVHQAADLLNAVVPTHVTWLRPPGSQSIAANFTANPAEAGAYLGLPLLAILVLAAWRRPRRRLTTILLLTSLVIGVCSLGSHIRAAGQTVAFGLWELPAHLPLTRAILPVRLSMYVALLSALVCALWLAQGGRFPRARYVLALAAAVALVPVSSSDFWTRSVPNPPFFSSDASDAALRPADTVLVLPFGEYGWSMYWQAESEMRYRMVGGYVGNLPPRERRWALFLRRLTTGALPRDASRAFDAFLRGHETTAVVVAPGTRRALRQLVKALPARPIREGDVTLYRLGASFS